MNESLIAIKELKDVSFYINKYQRGYRWGTREIHALLKDVYSFDPTKDSFYCLQPLVVIQREENVFELIDGQQRSTTIYLILKYLFQEDYYKINYETRGEGDGGTNVFLSNLQTQTFPEKIYDTDFEFDTSIWSHWKSNIVTNYQIEDSVDNFYFFKAYCIIRRWFGGDDSKKEQFKHNLLHHTKVIWYKESIDHSEVANSFINFNDGKISLDQAELVKGLFVLNFKTITDATRRSYEENQFADEWNVIEQHLRRPEFWNFIHKSKSNKDLANKITLLLQLEKGKGKRDEDLFYTFRAYEKAFEEKENPDWRDLTAVYNLLDEWFQNRETYHLMGAVVHLTNATIHDVLSNYRRSKKKDDLNNYLREVLVKEFFTESKTEFKATYDVNSIKYGKSGVFPVLFLYNIAVAQLRDKKAFFPFDLFAHVRSWNIEHIYAKNSLGFESEQDLREWLDEIKDIKIEDVQLDSNLELNRLLEQITTDDLEFSNSLVKKVELLLVDLLDKDGLSNLCLLDNKTNIQVGNKIFRKKREMVLEINHQLDENAFVPTATQRVFQKSLTPSDQLKMNYWNSMDRDAYLNDIQEMIFEFLTPKK